MTEEKKKWYRGEDDYEGWQFSGGHFNHLPERMLIFGDQFSQIGALSNLATANSRTRSIRMLHVEPHSFITNAKGEKTADQNNLLGVGNPTHHTAVNPYGERFYVRPPDNLTQPYKKPEDWEDEDHREFKQVWTLVKTDLQGRPMQYAPMLANGKEIVDRYRGPRPKDEEQEGITRGSNGLPRVVVGDDMEVYVFWLAYSDGWDTSKKRLYHWINNDFHGPRPFYPTTLMARKYTRDLELEWEHIEAVSHPYTTNSFVDPSGAWYALPGGGALWWADVYLDPDVYEEIYLKHWETASGIIFHQKRGDAIERTLRDPQLLETYFQCIKFSKGGSPTKYMFYDPKDILIRYSFADIFRWGPYLRWGFPYSLNVNKQGRFMVVTSIPKVTGSNVEQEADVMSLYHGDVGTMTLNKLDTGYTQPDSVDTYRDFNGNVIRRYTYKFNLPHQSSWSRHQSYSSQQGDIYVDDDGNFYLVTGLKHTELIEEGYANLIWNLEDAIWKFDHHGAPVWYLSRIDDQTRFDFIRKVGHIDRDGYAVAGINMHRKSSIASQSGNFEEWLAATEGLDPPLSASLGAIAEIDPHGKITRAWVWSHSGKTRPSDSTTPPPGDWPPGLSWGRMGGQYWGIFSQFVFREGTLIRGISNVEFPGHPAIFQLPEHLRRRPETDPRRHILYGRGKNQAWPPPEEEDDEDGDGD